jgi:undecaprenyl-diphosphatase
MMDAIIIFFASYLQYVLGALLVVFAILSRKNIRTGIVALVAGGISRLAIKPLILLFVHRARPYVALESVLNIIGPQTGEEYQSFPSGHALVFFAIATVVYRHNKQWGLVFFSGATLMGIARVLGGIHWATDILAGAIIGIVVGLIIEKLYARFCHQS